MSRRTDGRAVAATISNPLSFFAFVAFGCAYIVCAKLAALSPFLVTFVPVAVMIIYAACVKFVRLLRLREDQADDNLYYLGFLYTLTSLGVSLYQFRADGPAEEIVQNFGVAIGSTIAGVALRVMFAQMRVDPADVEHSARLEMAEAARKMRRELDAAVVELAHFRRATEQQVVEGFDSVRVGMEQVSTRILSSFEDMTVRASKPFESASESSGTVLTELAARIGGSLDEAARRLADENEKLASGTSRIATALGATADRLAAMQTPDKIIDVRFEPIAASLETTMRGFAEEIRRKDEIDRGVIEAITRSGEQHRKQAVSLGNLAKSIDKRSETMIANDERALAMSERTVRLLETMDADRSRREAADMRRDDDLREMKTALASMTEASSLAELRQGSAANDFRSGGRIDGSTGADDISASVVVGLERDLDEEFATRAGTPAVAAAR